MTFKKIFSLMLATLIISATVFCVSAETPTYSWNFEQKEAMIESLDDYIENYPFVDGYPLRKYIPEYYHLELKDVAIPQPEVGEYKAESFAYGESVYRNGVDYTFASYSLDGVSNALRFLVYYDLNTEEIQKQLNVEGAIKFEENENGHIHYCAIENNETDSLTKCEYRIAVWDKLVIAYSNKPYDENFYWNVEYEDTGLFLPVKVKDSAEWFDEKLEGCRIIGDVNKDEKLNIRDATALQKYLAKIDEVYKLVADFNGDLKIDIRDVTDIQKKLAGLKYTCRRELYPVTFTYRNDTEEKVIESVKYSSGPLSSGELDLILNYDTPDVSNYTTVFKSAEEFEAFFGRSSERFDEEFFKTKALVYLYRFYFSSSQHIAPDSLTYKDGVLHIWCGYDDPGEDGGWQEALANYNIYFEVNKEDIKDLRGIKVSQVTAVYD